VTDFDDRDVDGINNYTVGKILEIGYFLAVYISTELLHRAALWLVHTASKRRFLAIIDRPLIFCNRHRA
jgi:hypothetical protein